MSDPLVTVITPTFNRSAVLHRVYDSLCSQTISHDLIEWLVIDDGSTDDTGSLVRRWKREADFSIRYHWQANRGKHTAYNIGLQMAAGRFLAVLDSDDSCLPHTFERLLSEWDAIADPALYFAVGCRCQDQHGNEIGDRFTVSEVTSLRQKFNDIHVSEGWALLRTDILKSFPFPEFPEERFCPEDLVWNRLFSRYRVRLINDPLRIYYRNSHDSLKSKAIALRARCIKGSSAVYRELAMADVPVKMRVRALAVWGALLIRHSIHWY